MTEDRDARLAALLEARRKAQAQLELKHRRSRKIGISITVGCIGLAGAATSYVLGSMAYATYKDATTQSVVESARAELDAYGVLFPVSIGVGAAGIVSTTIFLLSRPDSDSARTTEKSLKASIRSLDEQIADLEAQDPGESK